jgi:2-polyprenyl-6-methoxyphenol hydroxylase-like FAD-dependent oxidoreductase
LIGYGPEHSPPTDDAGYLDFLAGVAPADVLAAVTAAEPLDEVVTHAFPASRRRRYERLERFPFGVLAIGDAISSFNPVYGQGMSVAALEALALRQALASGTARLPQRYYRASSGIVDVAWDLATGSDLSIPEVTGARPILTRLSNAWAERILQAAEHDAYVAGVFGSVTDLVASPTVLMRPRFAWKVVTRSRAVNQAHGESVQAA